VRPTNRIPTLDGWRGVAILLVLIDHTARHSRFKDQMWASLGFFGVDIFFVLSGYIITARLMEERAKSSAIDLYAFSLRRAFRILPPVVAYLVTVCLLALFLRMNIGPSEVFGSLFFFRNYQIAASPGGIYTAHFWSLSIEEHFYLLWPPLLLWLGNRRGIWLAAIGAVTCGLWRIYDYTHPTGMIGGLLSGSIPELRFLRTDVRLDGLLLGCLLALVLPSIRGFIFRNFPKETPLFAALFIFFNLQWNKGYPTLTTYLLVTVMVASTLVVEEGLVHKWLNLRPLVWVGTVSYSIYIWQQLFLLHPDSGAPLGILSALPFSIACIFATAACSFYFIEQPAIAFGKRKLVRKNAKRMRPLSQ
jgi:peptidoglycan/LPS O-acetylase OafA/YrhL